MEQTKTTNWQRAPTAKEQPMPGFLTTPVKNPEKKPKVSTVKATVSPTVSPGVSNKTTVASSGANTLNINGIKLDAEMARSAIILSEIIGQPKAKRRRGR